MAGSGLAAGALAVFHLEVPVRAGIAGNGDGLHLLAEEAATGHHLILGMNEHITAAIALESLGHSRRADVAQTAAAHLLRRAERIGQFAVGHHEVGRGGASQRGVHIHRGGGVALRGARGHGQSHDRQT